MSRLFFFFFPCLPALLLVIGAPVAASAPPLTETVQRFLEQQAARPGEKIAVSVQDPKVAYGACPDPRPFLPGNGQRLQGRVSVGVRCGERGQVRYLQAQVSVIGDYWVTRQALEPGTVIKADMLERKQGDLGELPRHAIRELDQAVGQVATRPLAAHTVLSERQLKRDPLVQRRQKVQVQARGPGFRIAREGQALDAGAQGDEIRVRMSNRQTLTATVTGPGRAQVGY